MSKVAVIRCENYEHDNLKNAVQKGIDLLGGIGQFIKSGEKILLKPNLLSADPPEKCTTTNFNFFGAVAEIIMASGAKVSYGDSPGIHSPEAAARKAGLEKKAQELGIRLADFKEGQEISFNEGRQNKKFIIANGILESDGVISLPKLKTHGLARMTGCIKNQFGCIPGPLKGEFHVRLPDVFDFCRMLVDLNSYIKPRLYIMDGVMAMEGNGPRSGVPRKMNVILVSADPVALDATVCRMVNMKPEYVPTIVFGQEAGLGSYQNIEIVGDRVEDFIVKDFDVVRKPVSPYKQGGINSLLKNVIVPKPFIDSRKCIKCGVCVNACPVKDKAVNWHDGVKTNPPTYMYKRCIRCYCCQEMCPEGAIELKVPVIRRLITGKK